MIFDWSDRQNDRYQIGREINDGETIDGLKDR